MGKDEADRGAKSDKAVDREIRSAQALRANLRRRKAQEHERHDGPPTNPRKAPEPVGKP